MSEARRGLARVATNYLRLVLTIFLGLWLARVQWDAVGPEGFGLIALLGSTAGLAAVVDAVIRKSMIRELGSAYHDPDPKALPFAYNCSLVVVGFAALLTATVAGGIWLAIPLFNVPPGWDTAARVYAICKGAEYVAQILMTPAYNLYLVTERMVAYNTWTTVNRVVVLVAGLITLATRDPADLPAALMTYGVLSAAGHTLFTLLAIGILVVKMPVIIPNLSLATAAGARGIAKVGGWNALIILSNNLHLRLDAILMNLWFGTAFGNVVFGTGALLASYVRRITSGMTDGIDAVAARVSSTGDEGNVRSLVESQTRLNAFVAAPMAVFLAILTQPVLDVWLENRLRDADPALVPAAVLMGRILILGTAARAVADAWVRIFYGTGHVRQFGWLTVIAGLCNPLIAVAIYYSGILPQSWRFTAPAMAYVLSYAVFAMLILPIPASRIIGASYWSIQRPIVPSLICAAAASPPLFVMRAMVQEWNLLWLGVAGAAYSILLMPLSWLIVLKREERQRLTHFLRRVADPKTRRQALRGGGGKGRKRRLAAGDAGGGGD